MGIFSIGKKSKSSDEYMNIIMDYHQSITNKLMCTKIQNDCWLISLSFLYAFGFSSLMASGIRISKYKKLINKITEVFLRGDKYIADQFFEQIIYFSEFFAKKSPVGYWKPEGYNREFRTGLEEMYISFGDALLIPDLIIGFVKEPKIKLNYQELERFRNVFIGSVAVELKLFLEDLIEPNENTD